MSTSNVRQFHMRDRLGQGGFGVVYRAMMVSPGGLRNEVAVKLLHSPTPDAVRRLRREGKLISSLRHPAILKAFDLVSLGGQVALITEYVAGMDLTEAYKLDNKPSARAVVQVICVVAEALDAAFVTIPPDGREPLRLVHRDIKPSNIRLGDHGQVKLLDFGIAFSEEDEAEEGADAGTRGTSVIGSVPYMAPERFWRTLARPEGDTYGLGCTLFEGVLGERLHDSASLGEMARVCSNPENHDQYVNGRIDQLADTGADGELVSLLRRMLCFDVDARPSAAEVATTCEALAEHMQGERLKTWCRRHQQANWVGDKGPLSGQSLTEGSLDVVSALSHLGASDETSAWPAPGAEADDDGFGVTVSVMPSQGSLPHLDNNSRNVAAASSEPNLPSRGSLPVILAGVFGSLFAIGAVGVWASGSWAPTAALQPAVEVATEPIEVPPPAPRGTDYEVSEVEAPPTSAPSAQPTQKAVTPRQPTQPAKATPKPEPAAQVLPDEPLAAVAAKPGKLRVTGEVVRVELRAATGSFAAGEVPAGSYTVFADFAGGGFEESDLRVVVQSGATLTVKCNPILWECTVE